MAFDSQAYKAVLSRFASGVTIVTTRIDGVPHGLTVSAFCSVSAAPPRVLVCLANSTDSKPLIERSGVFAVHILGRDQVELGLRFAKLEADAPEPFEGLDHRSERTGAPILNDCLAWLDCRVESMVPAGDHTIFVGAVETGGESVLAGEPVVYYRRGWRALDPLPLI